MLHPDSLNAESLGRGISRLADRAPASLRDRLDMNAAERIPDFFLDQVRQLDEAAGNSVRRLQTR